MLKEPPKGGGVKIPKQKGDEKLKTKAMVGLLALGIAIFLVSASSIAYFHDTEAGKNNLFAAGTWGGTETAWAGGSVDTPGANLLGWTEFGPGWGGYFSFNPDDAPESIPLRAARHIPVGILFIDFNGSDNIVQVEFHLDDDFYLEETHVYIGTSIPSHVPGSYPFKDDNLPAGTQYWFCENNLGSNLDNQYIAAHAVVYSDNWG